MSTSRARATSSVSWTVERLTGNDVPRPRDQLGTKDHPEFLTLRRDLFAFIEQGHELV